MAAESTSTPNIETVVSVETGASGIDAPAVPETLLKCVTRDSQEVEIKRSLLEKMKVVKNMIGDIDEADLMTNIIPLQIDMKELTVILEYLELAPANYEGQDLKDAAGIKYREVYEKGGARADKLKALSNEVLIPILLAANWAEIPELVHFCCITIAGSIKGKSQMEIRALFGVYSAPSEEEIKQAENAYPWIKSSEPTTGESAAAPVTSSA